MNPLPQSGDKLRFDRTVTLGNLLTVVTLIGGMLLAWSTMEGRVTQVEDTQARSQVVVEKQTAILQELQINTARLSTLMDVYIPEIEGIKKDHDTELEQRQGRR